MNCPKCKKELCPSERSSEETDSYGEGFFAPETIIRVPKIKYICVDCQIEIIETLPPIHYKSI